MKRGIRLNINGQKPNYLRFADDVVLKANNFDDIRTNRIEI